MKILADRQHIFPTTKAFGALLLAALLIFLASPGETNTGTFVWIALVPFLYAINQRGTRPFKAAITGLFFGLFCYCSLLYWIMIVLGNYGQLPIWLTLPALLLLAFYMSLYPALFGYLTCRLQNRFPLVWLAPVIWVALDWLRSFAFTGFPWMDLAYTQFRNPKFMQIADLGGHYGLTFMIVMVNCLIFSIIQSRFDTECRHTRSLASPLLALLLIASCLVYNGVRFHNLEKVLEKAPRMNVTVVQGNIDQGQKWLPSRQRETLNKYLKMSHGITAEQNTDLVIWPETAMPFYLQESRFLSRIKALTLSESAPCILTGAPFRKITPGAEKPSYYNSAFMISAGKSDILRYDKQHLVPFGEYVPLKKLLPFLAPFVEAVADFTPGRSFTPMPCHEGKVGVLICFESIFPALARAQTSAGANLLVNLTNDAWYGRSSAPWQHLSMIVFRAVENRRSLARSANTGVSCFIDPLGRMSKASSLYEDFTANESVHLIKEKTFFTYGIGGYFGIFCMCITILFSIIGFKYPLLNDTKGDQDVN